MIAKEIGKLNVGNLKVLLFDNKTIRVYFKTKYLDFRLYPYYRGGWFGWKVCVEPIGIVAWFDYYTISLFKRVKDDGI